MKGKWIIAALCSIAAAGFVLMVAGVQLPWLFWTGFYMLLFGVFSTLLLTTAAAAAYVAVRTEYGKSSLRYPLPCDDDSPPYRIGRLLADGKENALLPVALVKLLDEDSGE